MSRRLTARKRIAVWWTQPGGPREVLKIALPLVVSTLSFCVMHFCDRMFLAWHSTIAVGAAITAGALIWTLFSLPMGIASYATTFVAQYHGAKHDRRIGLVVWQAIRIGLYCIPFFLGLAIFAPRIFSLAGHSEFLLVQESLYFQTLALGAGAVVLSAALESFYVGRGKTRVIMITNVLAALLNIFLDGWLIFGGIGVPAMGIMGAGIATSISMWFRVLIYCWIMIPRRSDPYDLRGGRCWNAGLSWRLLKFGAPNGIQYFLEGAAITIFVLIVGAISEQGAAATAIAFSVNMVAFVPILGAGMALTSIVGRRIGSGQPEIASRATFTTLWMSLLYCSGFAAAYLLVPHWFIAAHSAGSSEFEPVGQLVVVLLRFVAAYCLFDAVQLVFVSAIKGAGDTRYVLWVTLLSACGFILGGRLLTVTMTGAADVVLIWWGALTTWIVILALAYSLRFAQGRWKSMTVIEPDLLADAGAATRIETSHNLVPEGASPIPASVGSSD